MSRRLNLLKHLLAQLEATRQALVAQRQQLRDELKRGEQRAQQLGAYRLEYAHQGVARLRQGGSPALLLTRQAFDGQLGRLGEHQAQALEPLQARLATLDAEWQQLQAREAGLRKVADRLRRQQARQANQIEQKNQDEWATQARGDAFD